MSARKVANELGVNVQSIYNWFGRWQAQDVCGLLTVHGDGRPRAQPQAMLATAMKIASTEFVTLGQITKRLDAAHGEPMSCAHGNRVGCTSAGRLLFQAQPGGLRDEIGHSRQTAMRRSRQRRASGLSRCSELCRFASSTKGVVTARFSPVCRTSLPLPPIGAWRTRLRRKCTGFPRRDFVDQRRRRHRIHRVGRPARQ